MNYDLLKDSMDLLRDFENQNLNNPKYPNDINGFTHWIFDSVAKKTKTEEPYWEGKENGRSPESAICTFIVHLNRYAKNYSKAAIWDSDFSNQEDFIYLINLKVFGPMTKMALIKKNVHEKPAGMQIISRLIHQGWVMQGDSETDKRSKVISITPKGLLTLENQMEKISQASKIVTGDLNHGEKMELIRLMNKLNEFHHTIYCKNLEHSELLNVALHDIHQN